jgi:hypothetical protein
VRWQKWLFWFFSVGLCVGKNQMCHLWVGCLFYTDAKRFADKKGGEIEANKLSTQYKDNWSYTFSKPIKQPSF